MVLVFSSFSVFVFSFSDSVLDFSSSLDFVLVVKVLVAVGKDLVPDGKKPVVDTEVIVGKELDSFFGAGAGEERTTMGAMATRRNVRMVVECILIGLLGVGWLVVIDLKLD